MRLKHAPIKKQNKSRLSVIGLGKLGAPFLAAAASRGFQIIGVDVQQEAVDQINRQQAPVIETGLADLLKENQKHYRATQDIGEAVLNSDISFIIVPTPSLKNGEFTFRFVEEAASGLAKALKEKKGYHVVALTSTVMPGTSGEKLIPLLEHVSGKQCGRDFGVCYNPEFIALGSVIRDMLAPDYVLIGESDKKAGDILETFYASFCINQAPVKRMNLVNAELTKLAVNTFVTTKISYANMLAGVCEKIPGADVDAVTGAVGMDSRIGSKYLRGALGYGGPCFPRDNRAFSRLAASIGANAVLARATDAINGERLDWLEAQVLQALPKKGGRVGILGLAYKPETPVIEQSQGLELAGRLLARGISLSVYDPLALASLNGSLKNALRCQSLKECISVSDVVVIATPWNEFKKAGALIHQADPHGKKIIIDCWRILDRTKLNGSRYIALGQYDGVSQEKGIDA